MTIQTETFKDFCGAGSGDEFTRPEWGAAGRAAAQWTLPTPLPTYWGPAVPSLYFEIRIAGVLPPEALLDFERLSASAEQVETVLHGPLADQAALYGLLARLETLGVQILEVRRLHDQDSPPQQ